MDGSARLLLIEMNNTSSMPFTHIEITKPSLGAIDESRLSTAMTPAEQGILPFNPITHLPAGSSCIAQSALQLGGSRNAVRFHLHTDRGAFPVELRPPMGELVGPAPIEPDAFEKLRSRLAGMNHVTASVPPPAAASSAPPPPPAVDMVGGSSITRWPPIGTPDMGYVAAVALQHMNAALVGGSEPSEPLRLSSTTLHDGRPMLAVLEPPAEAGGVLKVHVHAEDAIGGNILLDELTRGLREAA